MQTSITAWLKKPAAVTAPPSPSNEQAVPPIASNETISGIATPPPETTDSGERDNDSKLDNPIAQDSSSPILSALTLRPLHPNITLTPCTPSLLPGLKRLNALLLPIPYGPNFYNETLSSSTVSSITLLATWPNPNSSKPSTRDERAEKVPGKVIGAIRCRLLPPSEPTQTTTASNQPSDPASKAAAAANKPIMLYISTLAVLSPYRSHGIASHLLSTVISRAVREHGISEVGAHVWESSTEALDWYKKRGFEVVRREEGYYRRLEPSGAVVVRLRV